MLQSNCSSSLWLAKAAEVEASNIIGTGRGVLQLWKQSVVMVGMNQSGVAVK